MKSCINNTRARLGSNQSESDTFVKVMLEFMQVSKWKNERKASTRILLCWLSRVTETTVIRHWWAV
jgi:hypothetical protein